MKKSIVKFIFPILVLTHFSVKMVGEWQNDEKTTITVQETEMIYNKNLKAELSDWEVEV